MGNACLAGMALAEIAPISTGGNKSLVAGKARYPLFFITNEKSTTAAATAIFNDSAPPGMGMLTIRSASD